MNIHSTTTDRHPHGEVTGGKGKLGMVYNVLSTWHLQIITVLLITNKFFEMDHALFNTLHILATYALVALAIAQIFFGPHTEAMKAHRDIILTAARRLMLIPIGCVLATLNTCRPYLWTASLPFLALVSLVVMVLTTVYLMVQALFGYLGMIAHEAHQKFRALVNSATLKFRALLCSLNEWGTYLGKHLARWSILIGTSVFLLLLLGSLPMYLGWLLRAAGATDEEVTAGRFFMVAPSLFVFYFLVPSNYVAKILSWYAWKVGFSEAPEGLAEGPIQENGFWPLVSDNDLGTKLIMALLAALATLFGSFTLVLAGTVA